MKKGNEALEEVRDPRSHFGAVFEGDFSNGPGGVIDDGHFDGFWAGLDLVDDFGEDLGEVRLYVRECGDCEVAQEGVSGLPDFRDGILLF